jgi:hypothetical protein
MPIRQHCETVHFIPACNSPNLYLQIVCIKIKPNVNHLSLNYEQTFPWRRQCKFLI